MHFLSKFALCLAAIVFLAAGQLHACSDYVHLWRPVKEERGSAFSPEGIALFIDHVVSQLKSPGKVYKLSVNPASDVSDALKDSIMKSAVLVSKIQAVWAEASTPFAGEASASIWLDFVKPERMVYLWEDQNKPPFAMFRCGEIDTARVRVLVQNSQGKIEMIDELPYMFLLESDFMLPGWLSAGGVWFRRLSFKTGQMSHRHEWTMSVPSDIEDINQTPSDIRRFFYGDLPSDSIQIYSNY